MYDVYYKIYLTSEKIFTVVCLQDFDEIDYNQGRFLTDATTNAVLKFNSERDAIDYLNTQIKSEFIDSEYRTVDFSQYRL